MRTLPAHEIENSQTVSQLLDQAVDQVVQKSAAIKGPQGPISDFEKSAQEQMDQIGKIRGRPLYYPYIGSGLGRGPYVQLEDGSIKLDLINGIGIHLFGHSHPRVIKAAMRGALSDVVNLGHLQVNKEYIQLSKKLIELASKKSRLRHVWLTTCGTMANENALKMARQKNSPARMIMSMTDAFAGRSTMMAEITDNPDYKQGLPEYNEVLRIPYYDYRDPQSSEKALRVMKEHVAKFEKNICAFAFEPMLGEGGYRVAPREYWVPMLEFCKQNKIAVWADEIQTFTRTGEIFAFETLGFGDYVDLCTIAKTAQVGATFYTEEYNPKPGLIAGTFAGSTAAMTAGLEILKMISEEGYTGADGKIAKIHRSFVGMLNRLNETSCKGLLREAGGLGLMIAVTPLDGSKDKIATLQKVLFKHGMITYSCGKNPMRIRFLVPAVMTESDIEVAGQIIEKSILEMAGK